MLLDFPLESPPALTHRLTDQDLPGLSYDSIARLLHARLANAGSIIDPSYTQPLVSAGPVAEDEAALLTLVSDPVALNREMRRLSRVHGENSEELTEFLGRAAAKLRQLARFSEAEPFARRALAIDEKSFGPNHPNVARNLNNLAQLLYATNRLSEAEPLMRRALAIDEASFGPDHPRVGVQLNNLAELLKATNRLSEAEPLMRRALAIDEKSFGPARLRSCPIAWLGPSEHKDGARKPDWPPHCDGPQRSRGKRRRRRAHGLSQP
jgi:tetratricopeptide (TPR) repeat protein